MYVPAARVKQESKPWPHNFLHTKFGQINESNMDKINIRTSVRADQAFLWDALYHGIYFPSDGAPPDKQIVKIPELALYVENWLKRRTDLGVIAEESAKPIGAAWLRCWTPDRHGYGYIDTKIPELSMSLLPDYRGKGIGTKLLHLLFSLAKDRFDSISLSVSYENPAKRLYERNGFISVDTESGGSLIMQKNLS